MKPPKRLKIMIDKGGRKYRSSRAANNGRPCDLPHSPMIDPAASPMEADPERTLSAFIEREIPLVWWLRRSASIENALFSRPAPTTATARTKKTRGNIGPMVSVLASGKAMKGPPPASGRQGAETTERLLTPEAAAPCRAD
ncbi:MAG TPA: hypothetical protein VN699_05050 [Pirellulales bacterium]|nr:hypothetical protein [Pirellulales bacterium]